MRLLAKFAVGLILASSYPMAAMGAELPDYLSSGAHTLQVFKSPSCGCCNDWIAHAEQKGFLVESSHPTSLAALKIELGIQLRYQSCHTTVAENGFVFEGHIPIKLVTQFLDNPPDEAIGLAVPGMPVGSPGMEVGDKFMPYQVLLLKRDGSHEIYADISRPEQQY